jgi:amino acid transporter
LRRNNSTIALISFLTTLLILVISLFPFIIQLTSGKNAYGDYIQLKEEILFEEYDIIANNKEHLAGKVEELKERFTIDTKDLESLVKNIDTTSTKKKDENSFTSYLQEMLSRYNDEIINNERKSKSLFWYGIVFSVFGIMTAFGFLVFWLNYFSFNKFETYHVYTLISGTVIIVLIEFLGAWFLKQHRIVSSKSLQILSHKAVIDRYALMYKAVTDLAGPENRLTYLSHLLSLIEKDLKFPKTAFDSTSDFANDATSSLLKVGKFS